MTVTTQAEYPPRLMTSEPGSFARRTIVEGKPHNVHQAIEDNDYPPDIVHALEALAAELVSGPMRPLRERTPGAGNWELWNRELVAYRGKTWLEVDWHFAETYFYRRLLEAVRYFQPGLWQKHDPFGRQKRTLAASAVVHLSTEWGPLIPATGFASDGADTLFEPLLHACLWGNRADLSNYDLALQDVQSAGKEGERARQGQEEQHNLLIDHTHAVRSWLASRTATGQPSPRIDVINDNVGLDLLFDLVLADFMLAQDQARQVVFHVKAHPFFVSDAMPKDVWATVALVQEAPHPSIRAMGARLRGHLDAGRLILRDDPLWTSCLTFRDLFCTHRPRAGRASSSLRAELGRSDLIILKGDLNYRRLLDDRRWPHTTPLAEAAAYFPAPFLVLRTLKGEIMVGLEPGQAEALDAQDPDWLTNGQRGIIHWIA